MGITSSGIGSGIDVNSIVSQLMAIERQPLTVLDQKKADYNTQLSSYGILKSDLSGFQTAAAALKDSNTFAVFSATAADPTLLSATTSSTAIAGTHSITINALAKSQIQVSGTGFATTDTTPVGAVGDMLSFTSGTNTFSVTLDSTNNSLVGLQNAINSSASNYGVTASILNNGTTNKLVISANNSGLANSVTLGGTLATSLASTTTQAATDASLNVDGVPITSTSNTVSNVLPGVTLTLQNIGTTNLSVTRDVSAITSKVTDFVNSYNKLVTAIGNDRMKGGPLEADSTALSIQDQLTGVINTTANIAGGSYGYLAQVGVSIQKDGTMALDSTAFTSAISTNFNSVVSLFTDSSQGFASRLYDQSFNMLGSGGLLQNKTDGLNNRINDIQTQSDQLNSRLVLTQQRLQAEYSAMDSMVASMRQAATYLSSI